MENIELPTNILILTEKEDIMRAMKASSLCAVLWDFKEYLRSSWKYEGKSSLPIEEVEEKLNDIMYDNHINLDELYY